MVSYKHSSELTRHRCPVSAGRVLAAALLSLLLAQSAVAQTVYRHVEDGVPSFSDSPPADGRDVEAIELDVPQPSTDPDLEARLSALRETTDRMAEDRRAREQHRAQLRALRTPPPAPAAPSQPTVVVAGGLWPAYLRPGRPGWPQRPQPPLRPAPTPPGWSVMQPGNAQLMRPIVSRRD